MSIVIHKRIDVMLPNDYSETITREDVIEGGRAIIRREIKREVRFVRSVDSFGFKMMIRETPISETTYRRRGWGPFGWWEKQA